MYGLIGNHRGYYLNWICKTEGSLYLVGDRLSPIEKIKKDESFDRKFVIKVTSRAPKKVDRKTVFYASMSCDLKSFYLIYIDCNGKIVFCENIELRVDEQGNISFDLTNILQEKNIPFIIPKKSRLNFFDKIDMQVDLCFKTYGIARYRPAHGTAYDGTGSGYAYHLWPDYLVSNGVKINYLLVQSYYVEPIALAVDEFFESLDKEHTVSAKKLENLLHAICGGNEFAVQTDDISIHIYRHYTRMIKVDAFDKCYARELPEEDAKFEVGSSEKEWPDKMERIKNAYVSFISRVIMSKTEEDVQTIVDTFLSR